MKINRRQAIFATIGCVIAPLAASSQGQAMTVSRLIEKYRAAKQPTSISHATWRQFYALDSELSEALGRDATVADLTLENFFRLNLWMRRRGSSRATCRDRLRRFAILQAFAARARIIR